MGTMHGVEVIPVVCPEISRDTARSIADFRQHELSVAEIATAVRRGLDYLRKNYGSALIPNPFFYYTHYYAAQAMWQAGGDVY